MNTVTSADGTEIAYEQTGDGRPLVLVHGGGVTRRIWDGIQPHLTDDTMFVIPDRRGRGDSGDADEYSLEREVADIRAVLDATDGEPILFGHSFGALVALEAVQAVSVERLILYEPALLTEKHRHGAHLASEMEALLDASDRRQAVKLYFEAAAGAEDIEQWPIWPECVALAETIVRENRAIEQYRLDAPDVSVPTLLLMSEKGPEHLRDGVRAVHDTLADSRLIELDGVGHGGVSSAPGQVADEVRPFVRDV
jgi:pimeloyl-ACP methyl ester carboxylesterase